MNISKHLPTAAAEFAAQGLAVFPCQPRGKEPATKNGLYDGTTDIERIHFWWSRVPDCNIGIATGAVSGFFCLDIDGEQGEASLRELEAKHGLLPTTIETITGKGRHAWYRIGEHGAIRNSASTIAPGLDIRGDGGYVIAPPSIHPSGKRYEWSVDSNDEFAEAPEWLHELIQGAKQNGGAKGKPVEHWHRVLTNAIRNGERNTTLASVCGKLLHFGVTDLTLLFDIITCVNVARCDEPLPETEIETIVASVVRSHLRKLSGNG